MDFALIAVLVGAFFVIAALVTFMWFLVYTVFWGHFKGAPFVPSSRRQIADMIALAEIKAGETVYDLGSGSGSILFEAAKKGATAKGIEISPLLVLYTRLKAKWRGVPNVSVVRQDFRTARLSDADVVFLYLWPTTNALLCGKLKKELKPGTRIISNSFVVEGLTPEKKLGNVYKYSIERA